MILEIAQFRLKPKSTASFEVGVAQAVGLFRRAKGFRKLRLLRTIEDPDLFMLHVEWETLEDHTKRFRESDDFQEWRKLVGEYFAEVPKVVHCEITITAAL